MEYEVKITEFNGHDVIILPKAISANMKAKVGETLHVFWLDRGFLLSTREQFFLLRTAGKPKRMRRFQ
ncbi:hypothetical protein [Terracidiphilus gabretensis]|jgi:hypothetical protein|uniref:hypothetical protein n=1 Tax=Terracidiphilus gabretensis TaxID=1577687 RepID=UPI00071BE22C|nr:hypothetical protein [Terracidiphilus gabretensis]